MPSVKQGGGYTLTFSKKNKDIKDLLDSKKADGVVVTEYIITAIRFYEEYKDSIGADNLNLSMVEELVNKKMETLKRELLKAPTVIEDKTNDSYLENVSSKLESKINIDDD